MTLQAWSTLTFIQPFGRAHLVKTQAIARVFARSALVITCAVLTSECVQAAPQPLYGKSIVITWVEERQQKLEGEERLRFVGAAAEFDVYVSDAGRPFSRLRFSVANKHGRLRTGSRDVVGGEGSARNVSFSGTSMTASAPRGAGGALLIRVTFDNGFQGCSARVISGKEAGVVATRVKSFINGNRLEMYSVKTSGESCRIQSGNIFAN